MKYSGHRKLLCELSKLSLSDIKVTLRHLFLFTITAQRELVSICTHFESQRQYPFKKLYKEEF